MTPEAKFGISEEPTTTCQFLNNLAAELNNSVEAGFETIRKLNESLRAWGYAWKTQCINLSDSLDEAEDKISDLELNNKDLHKQVEELQDKLDRLS